MASKILRNANRSKAYKPIYGETKSCYEKGKSAYDRNNNDKVKAYYVNPYMKGTIDYDDWDKGYNDAYYNNLNEKQLRLYNALK